MTLEETIRHELRIAFDWGKAAGTSGILSTPEQVVESGAERIGKAIKEAQK